MPKTQVYNGAPKAYTANILPVLYVEDGRAVFAMLVKPYTESEGERAHGAGQPIVMSYADAVSLGEGILQTVEQASIDYFTAITLKPSSNIQEARYHMGRSVLRVTFKGGRTYDYFGVPASLIAEWGEAESTGKFFGTHIKGNEGIPFQKVED